MFAQAFQLFVAGLGGGKARSHAFKGGPDRDHVEDFGLGLANDEYATACDDLDEAFAFELRQRLAQRRAGDAEALGQVAFVEFQLGAGVVNVEISDRSLQRFIGARLEAQTLVDRNDLQLQPGHGAPSYPVRRFPTCAASDEGFVVVVSGIP